MAEPRKQSLVHRLIRRRRDSAARRRGAEAVEAVSFTGESIANELRQTREGLGRDIARVAEDLKIRRVYLQAIEEGRFDDLPGAAYAVGFVRVYADYLGLDSAEVVGRFKEEVHGLNERHRLVFPTPVPESKIPSGAVILISVVLVSLAYGSWYYLSSRGAEVEGLIPEVPENLESLVTESTEGGTDVPASTTENSPAISTDVAVLTLAETPQAEDGEATGETATAPTEEEIESPESGDSVTGTNLTAESTADQTAAEQTAEDQPVADQPVAEQPAANQPAEDQLAQEQPSQDQIAEAAVPQDSEPSLDAVEPAAVARTNAEPHGDATSRENGAGVPADLPVTVTPDSPRIVRSVTANNAIPAAPSTQALLPDREGREPRVYGVENKSARIVLRARLDSWVQVRDEEDSLLLTRVLQPGDTYRVPDQGGLTLLTGNAGGLQIEVDGAAVPPLGPIGAVRRGVALDPDRLLSGTANTR